MRLQNEILLKVDQLQLEAFTINDILELGTYDNLTTRNSIDGVYKLYHLRKLLYKDNNYENIVGNNNGYAKITFTEMIKELNEQIEITGINIKESSNSISTNEKYTTSTIDTTILLNEESSYAIYEIDVTNSGTRSMTIKNIKNNSPDLSYQLVNYNLKDKIAGQTTEKIILKVFG